MAWRRCSGVKISGQNWWSFRRIKCGLDLAKISEDFQVVEFPTKETPADAIENLLAVRKVAAKNHLEISAGHELLELEYIRRFLSYFNDPGGVYGILLGIKLA